MNIENNKQTIQDDKENEENFKLDYFKLNQVFLGKHFKQKSPIDANAIIVLGKLSQKIDVLEKSLIEKEKRICQLESSYKDLLECYRKCVTSQKTELDVFDSKWLKMHEKVKHSLSTRINDTESLFISEISMMNKRHDDIEANFLHLFRENENSLLLEMKSMNDKIAKNSTTACRLVSIKHLDPNSSNTLNKRHQNGVETQNISIQSSQKAKKTPTQPFLSLNTVNDNSLEYRLPSIKEEIDFSHEMVEKTVAEDKLSNGDNDDWALFSKADKESFASDGNSDMIVEIATLHYDNEILNLSSQSVEGSLDFESKYEYLNDKCGVFRWYIMDFHDVQFNGFDIFSPQFTIDYVTYFELNISWFDDLKQSIRLDLVTSDGMQSQKYNATATCEAYGFFNSQVITSDTKSEEPFLHIDETDVEASEKCNSKTLCDFIENNTLFINCYFSRNDFFG